MSRDLKAKMLVDPLVTQAKQFNRALEQLLLDDTEWVFRLDADQVVSGEIGFRAAHFPLFECTCSKCPITPLLGHLPSLPRP
jgi:hypothetical protein